MLICMLKRLLFFVAIAAVLNGCADSETEVKLYYETAEGDSVAAKPLKAEYRFLGEDSARIDGEYKRYYDNGNLAQVVVYQDGKPWTIQKTLDIKGEGLDGGTLNTGNGTLKRYNAQGKLLSVHTYKNGQLHGEAKFYDGFKSDEPIRTIMYAAGVPMDVDMTGTQPAVDEEQFMAQLDSLMQSGGGAQPMPGEEGAPPFNPAVADKLVGLYKSGNYDLLYGQMSSISRELYSKSAWSDYLAFTKNIYGSLSNFRRVDMQSGRDPQFGYAVQLMYEAQFKYTTGGIILSMVAQNGGYKLLDFNVQVQPYTPIQEITKYADPMMEKVKAGDWGALYDFSSSRFQQETPRAKFEELGEQFKQFGEVTDYELYTHQVGVMEDKLMVMAIYEVKVGGKTSAIQLLMTRFGNDFKLESINASDPNKMEQMQQQMQEGGGMQDGMQGGMQGGMPGGVPGAQ